MLINSASKVKEGFAKGFDAIYKGLQQSTLGTKAEIAALR